MALIGGWRPGPRPIARSTGESARQLYPDSLVHRVAAGTHRRCHSGFVCRRPRPSRRGHDSRRARPAAYARRQRSRCCRPRWPISLVHAGARRRPRRPRLHKPTSAAGLGRKPEQAFTHDVALRQQAAAQGRVRQQSDIAPPVGAPLVGARTLEQAGTEGGRPQGLPLQGLSRFVWVRAGDDRGTAARWSPVVLYRFQTETLPTARGSERQGTQGGWGQHPSPARPRSRPVRAEVGLADAMAGSTARAWIEKNVVETRMQDSAAGIDLHDTLGSAVPDRSGDGRLPSRGCRPPPGCRRT